MQQQMQPALHHSVVGDFQTAHSEVGGFVVVMEWDCGEVVVLPEFRWRVLRSLQVTWEVGRY